MIERLATYGTLSPGEPNHAQLAGIDGSWSRGTVRGRFVATGCPAAHGYPALVRDAAAPPVPVHLFAAADLAAHWSRLDAFEGVGYRRVVTEIATAGGTVDACLYVAADA